MKLYLLEVSPGEADVDVTEIAKIVEHPTRDGMRVAVYKRLCLGRTGTTVHPNNGQVISQLETTPFHIDPNPLMRCWCSDKSRKAATKNLLQSSLDFAKECVDGWNTKALAIRRLLDKA